MTTTRFHGLLHRDTGKDSQSTGSLLTFSPTMHPPGGAGAPPEAREDHVHAVGVLLDEFLVLLEAVQRELDERWSAQKNTGGHLDTV
ncbi:MULTISPECIES: hypothetical protein [Streptomyces]|uniref:hypothetical protein n=1 Tax=Streptomyces TaxID=1883 RepID=UPI0016733180|nr:MULTISPECIES: hypothetical protein [Streptomyces]MBK3521867.1 hypothetical protein [Streptomyces sp. MBT70]GGR79197.1 hypothetical protein GCM10010236_37310 [Streptomyces eurythermus]